jgi:hypothetical protein
MRGRVPDIHALLRNPKTWTARTSPATTSTNSILLYDFHEMRHLGDHPARLRRVDKLRNAADLIEPEPHQRFALPMMPALGAPSLPYLDGLSRILPGVHCTLQNRQSAAA